jgi:hypothetical protein
VTRRWRRSRIILVAVSIAFAAFLGWRFVRPMNIFVVTEDFERPIDTVGADIDPASLRAERCGACHPDEYREWSTSIHSQAWTDPYFQVDWAFDGRAAVCKNCHIPLDRQQESLTLGFRDRDKLEPVLASNPAFDPALQNEGVTCAACHLRGGHVVGPRAMSDAPHSVSAFSDPNEVCLRCHVVQGKRWDTFYRMPPCGTTAEIATTGGDFGRGSGEYVVRDAAALGCVQCHMPAAGQDAQGTAKPGIRRRHLWRGGHDPQMVRSALTASLTDRSDADGNHVAELALTNTGTAHFLPTGTPDRHLTVRLRALDAQGRVLRETTDTLERVILWRPFIVDLRDTRLASNSPRRFLLNLPRNARTVEAQVHYHLLAESRRKRIGYEPTEPISHVVFEERRTIASDFATSLTRAP